MILIKDSCVQILLGVKETVIRVNDDRDSLNQILKFIDTHFKSAKVTDELICIPSSSSEKPQRNFLMKWLYSYYKNQATNVNSELRMALLGRLEKPIKFYLPPIEKVVIEISATFYEQNICHISLNKANAKCDAFFKNYFYDNLTLKSKIFNIYEINASSNKQKNFLKLFFFKPEINGVELSFAYNKEALKTFVSLTNKKSELEKACSVLNVDINDSFSMIKKSYKKLAKECHPDLFTYESENSSHSATQSFQTLLNALHIIKKHKNVA